MAEFILLTLKVLVLFGSLAPFVIMAVTFTRHPRAKEVRYELW